MLYPLKCIPIFKERVWGGRNLEKLMDKRLPKDLPIGESWELSIREDAMTRIDNGRFMGWSLKEVMEKYPVEVLGRNWTQYLGTFPLLIKFIDASEKLSVQVHPDDTYAKLKEDSLGKTEAWYILWAQPEAKIIHGLKKGTTMEDFEKAVEGQRIEEVLQETQVKAGELYYIPAGTVHAIGEGIMILEVQQNSDITYRVYDWERMGLDGKPRELHVEKAMETIDFSGENKTVNHICIKHANHQSTILHCCPYFAIEILEVAEGYRGNLIGDRFEILTCVEGACLLNYGVREYEIVHRGETILLPAHLGNYKIEGKGKFIKSYPM